MSQLAKSLLLGAAQIFNGAVLRILGKSLLVTAMLFVLVTGAGWFVLDLALANFGLGDGLFAGAGELRGIASAALAIIGLWLCWRIIAMAVIQFYAEDVVAAVEARHYPQALHSVRELSALEQWRNAAGAAGRALLVNLIAAPFAIALIFTAIGPALLFWAVNALLLGRELQDMVWLRQQQAMQSRAPVGKAERFLLGGVIAALFAVPFANFLAPVLGAASATHLIHRRQQRSANPATG